MSTNGYSTPSSIVSNVGTTDPGDTVPVDVERACKLMKAALAITILVELFRVPPASIFISFVAVSIVGGILFLIVRWIVGKLRSRRNWMRLLITFAYASTALFNIAYWSLVKGTKVYFYGVPTVLVVVFAINQILSFAIVILINTPQARRWFSANA